VRTRRSPDDAEAQAERIASLVFMAGRGGQIIFSALMLANDRRRYDRPLLQAAALAGVVVESAWLSRRLLRARRYDDRLGVWVDCLSAAGAVLISQRGLGTGDAAPWAKNIAIGAAIGAASTRRPVDTAGTVGTLCAAAITTGLRAGGRDAHVAGLALSVNDAVNWAGTHIASRSYLSAHRRYARLRDEASALTVERAAASASETERSRQHELLHQVTVSVLHGIAGCAELSLAEAAARGEAARLRYALRTGGRVPRGLDWALAEVAEAQSAQGLRIELVTAELGTVPGTQATAALRLATQAALDAARTLGGSTRAVVRAVSTSDTITVTVRDHGRGFQPCAGSDYESQLLTIRDLLTPCGGTITTWSEPGGGVRVTLEISARHGGAGKPPGSVRDDRVRQRQPGSYPHGDDSIHQAIVAPPWRSRFSGADRFGELPAAQARLADRTLLRALLAWRATGLTTGAAALIAGSAHYRSRGLAVALLALAAGESAWYTRRVLRRDRWADPTSSSIDAAAAACIVLLGNANLDHPDRSTWINWPPWTFAANAICGQAMGVASATRALAGAGGVIGANATQSRRAGDAIADAAALAAFFSVARLLATLTRASAVHLEQALGLASAEGHRLAQARERSVQLRMLHDHALQTLETIAGGRFTDLDLIRSYARTEAARLGRELKGTSAAAHSLADRLGAVLAEHAGLHIEFGCPELPAIAEPVIQAFCGATDEALTNARKHAHADRARVTVHNAGGQLTVTIADQGAGFDQSVTPAGFGMRESIEQRMHDAGGTAHVVSALRAGTRVILSWPA
jgi:signal transduction histidine kinase